MCALFSPVVLSRPGKRIEKVGNKMGLNFGFAGGYKGGENTKNGKKGIQMLE